MAKGGLAFQTKNPPEGIDDATRRALCQLDVSVDHVVRLIKACERLGLKPDAPVYKQGAVAHVGIPSHKVAIHAQHYTETGKIIKSRSAWERHGWKLLSITARQIARMTDDEIAEQLKMALAELGKRKV